MDSRVVLLIAAGAGIFLLTRKPNAGPGAAAGATHVYTQGELIALGVSPSANSGRDWLLPQAPLSVARTWYPNYALQIGNRVNGPGGQQFLVVPG